MNRKLIGLLSGFHFIIDTYPGALVAVLPVIVTTLRLSYAEAGLITTALTATSSLTQPLFGLISDRKDRLWFLPIGCLLATASLSIVGFAPSYLGLIVLVIVGGFAVAAVHPISAKAANLVAGTRKATGMTLYATGGNLGYALGPLMVAPLLVAFGPKGFVYLAVPGLIMTALIWRTQNTFRQKTEPVVARGLAHLGEVRKSWGMVVRILLVMSFRMVTHWGIITFFPLYLINQRGAGTADISRMLFFFLFAGAAGTPLGGVLADRFGVRQVVIATLVVQPPMIFFLFRANDVVASILLALIGFSMLVAMPLLIVLAQEILPNNVALASGMIQGFGFGIGGIGISALGVVADAIGLEAALMIVALVPLPSVLLALGLPSSHLSGAPAPVAGSKPAS